MFQAVTQLIIFFLPSIQRRFIGHSYEPGAVLGPENRAVSKQTNKQTRHDHCSEELDNLVEKGGNNKL